MADQDSTVVELALGLMRDVKDRLEHFEKKLDEQITRNETVAALKVRVDQLEASHTWVKGMLGTLIAGVLMALIYKFLNGGK